MISPIVLYALLWFFGINVVSFIAFGEDKRRAKKGVWRISEQLLLRMALVGGTFGCLIGQEVWHHKTRKQPFGYYLYTIAVIQIVIIIAFIFPETRQVLWRFISYIGTS